MSQDSIRYKILADGTIRIETDQVSAANHMNAEEFLAFLASITDGNTERIRHGHSYQHQHEHEHIHEEEKV